MGSFFSIDGLLIGLVIAAYLLGLAGLLFVGWLILRILYRAAYPKRPELCPHCGKPL